MSKQVLEVAQNLIEGLKQSSGDNWVGCCPIHGEILGKSKPSFSINEATGLWYCFSGCGGGHLRKLLKILGKSRESIDLTMKRLDRYLVKVERKASPVAKGRLFRTDYPLPERILGLFETCPLELLEAGFDEDLLWEHDVGWDAERLRITFPIRDIEGTLAGIVGRTNEPGLKYKVYVQEIKDLGFSRYEFENHDYLWRWDTVYAQTFMADERPTVYAVEGFKACLWMVQNGYKNTVALMGTSLSDVQRIFLERLGGTLVWCLDLDAAGQKLVYKNGKKIHGVRQLVMNYPDLGVRLQPDDLSKAELDTAIKSSLIFGRWCAERRREIEK
jgi:DNA primase